MSPAVNVYRQFIAAQPAAIDKQRSTFRAELARYGITQKKPSDVQWNFEKFLIARDGTVVAPFAPDVAPNDPLLLEAIECALTMAEPK